MKRAADFVYYLGAGVFVLSMGLIIAAGHMPPGSVLWTFLGLSAVGGMAGGAALVLIASLVLILIKQDTAP